MLLNMNERGGNKGGPQAREKQLEGLRQGTSIPAESQAQPCCQATEV